MPTSKDKSFETDAITQRPRRLRGSASLRDMIAETHVKASDLIAPFFVIPGAGNEEAIGALPGISRFSVDLFLRELERALKLGVRSAILFGVLPVGEKDANASSANDPHGPVASAIRAARAVFSNDVTLISDVCLCGHTDHGHCGILRDTQNRSREARRGLIVDNDSSLERLSAMALVHAEAGVDFVAPSDMMDGRVGAIRRTLDAYQLEDVGIISYAVKYSSAFYGPFREAAGSAPSFGDRATYQMDSRNSREALREAALDELEGADMLMVKPALPYLDVIARVRDQTKLPLVAYNVSGEYAMLKAAANIGALDEPRAVRETLHSIKRAGADLIITYHALEALENGWL
jgi:porphobilinogen synthase